MRAILIQSKGNIITYILVFFFSSCFLLYYWKASNTPNEKITNRTSEKKTLVTDITNNYPSYKIVDSELFQIISEFTRQESLTISSSFGLAEHWANITVYDAKSESPIYFEVDIYYTEKQNNYVLNFLSVNRFSVNGNKMKVTKAYSGLEKSHIISNLVEHVSKINKSRNITTSTENNIPAHYTIRIFDVTDLNVEKNIISIIEKGSHQKYDKIENNLIAVCILNPQKAELFPKKSIHVNIFSQNGCLEIIEKNFEYNTDGEKSVVEIVHSLLNKELWDDLLNIARNSKLK